MLTAHAQRPPSAQVWLAAIRPATLTAALTPVLVGTALAAQDKQLRIDAALAALSGALFIQVGTNLFNDYADFIKGADTPERLGPARATQRGWLSPKQVLAGSFLSFGLAALIGVYLITIAGWPIAIAGALSIVAGVLYTGGPAPLAYHGLGDLFVMLFFGGVAVCGTYYVQTLALSGTAILCSCAVGALATAILVVNNLRDRVTDAKAGKRTLVVRFGETFGRVEYGALLTLAYLVPLVLCWFAPAPSAWYRLLPLLSLPMAASAVHRVVHTSGEALNVELGATAKLGVVYGALLSVGVLL